MLNVIAERYANTLYHHQPDILVARWWVPGHPILVGGSLIDAADFDHLTRDFSVGAVVNCETEHDDAGKVPQGQLLQVRVPDDGSPVPREYVRQLSDFVALWHQTGSALYVHCQMGGSRSPAFAYGVLRILGLSSAYALQKLNEGFAEKKRLCQEGESVAEHLYGWNPVHQAYMASIEEGLK